LEKEKKKKREERNPLFLLFPVKDRKGKKRLSPKHTPTLPEEVKNRGGGALFKSFPPRRGEGKSKKKPSFQPSRVTEKRKAKKKTYYL